jgi:F-type H+-transporting ATPase subunit b
MLIDWFTVAAQVLNFLVLIWLLKRFLYKPILNAIENREKRIAAELAAATATMSAAEAKREEFSKKSAALDDERSAILAQATKTAAAEGERLVGEARATAEHLRAQQQNALRADQIRLGREITRIATTEVFAIARKSLADLAGVGLEDRMREVFTGRLAQMDGTTRASLAATLTQPPSAAIVRSTFDVPPSGRAAIQSALNAALAAEIRLRFETAPDGVCGIELTAGSQKLAWSISSYLSTLEQKVAAVLDDQAKQAEPVPPGATAPVRETT